MLNCKHAHAKPVHAQLRMQALDRKIYRHKNGLPI